MWWSQCSRKVGGVPFFLCVWGGHVVVTVLPRGCLCLCVFVCGGHVLVTVLPMGDSVGGEGAHVVVTVLPPGGGGGAA
jgi:hypothetical protein